jgi:hypothetical protein
MYKIFEIGNFEKNLKKLLTTLKNLRFSKRSQKIVSKTHKFRGFAPFHFAQLSKFEVFRNSLLSKDEFEEYKKFKERLKAGSILGKSLNYDFFREERIGEKRIYFLVYKEIRIILFVNSSKKNYQQETIDEIKLLLPEFKRHVYNLYYKFKEKRKDLAFFYISCFKIF